MNPETRKALEESIQHRKNNATPGEFKVIYSHLCSLCGLFYNNSVYEEGEYIECVRIDEEGKSEQCPVAENTGESECEGSPWRLAVKALSAHGQDSVEFREAAQRMIKFLESLLPTD